MNSDMTPNGMVLDVSGVRVV